MKTLLAAVLAVVSLNVSAACLPVSTITDLSKYDLDGDGLIGYSDMQVFYGEFGSTDVTSPADFNGDGVVNLSDYSLFRKYFGVKDEVVTTVTCR